MRNEIERTGAISFARFTELALYSPAQGYYEREQPIGQRGDFFTSVSVGSLFGELLAFQFAEWLEEHGIPPARDGKTNLQIVEAGAHDGQLALDILNCLKKFRPKIFEQLDYCIYEPSPSRRDWQRKALAEFSDRVSWFAGWPDFPRSAFRVPRFTILFSNELFDAMPVHRVGWDARTKTWFEWGVGMAGETFVWKRLLKNQLSPISFPELDPDLQKVLPEAFTTEICPTATQWWTNASNFLSKGKLVAIDYGLLAEEFFVPERSNGTLRAFFRHHSTSDLLARPGEQDITAHVNFSALEKTGEVAGLKTDSLISQSKFLTAIAEQTWTRAERFGEWDARRRKQFQTLTHPEHLGRSFRVLVQSR